MRITRTAWFGRKRFGVGMGPRGLAGWLATAAWVIATIVAVNLWPRLITVLIAVVILLIMVPITS